MTSGRCVTSAHFAKTSLVIAKSKNKEKTLRIKIITLDGTLHCIKSGVTIAAVNIWPLPGLLLSGGTVRPDLEMWE